MKSLGYMIAVWKKNLDIQWLADKLSAVIKKEVLQNSSLYKTQARKK
jgi:hypothetical protein